MTQRPNSETSERALELFSALLDESDEELDPKAFQQLVDNHPEVAAELEALRQEWLGVEGVVDHLRDEALVALDPELDQRLRKRMEQLRSQRPGTVDYSRDEVLGRGGMATVYRTYDPRFRRSLALKIAQPSTRPGSREDSLATSRFLAEAEVTGQLEHPGIIPAYDLGVDESGQVFFTMRLVKGIDLNEVFQKRTRTQGVQLLLKVCEAVAYAHSKGVIHRDLKPANVMVGRFGETYVLDWGLAKVSQKASASGSGEEPVEQDRDRTLLTTLDGAVVGTPSFMAPEQARGEGRPEPRWDVYSIGAMLYQLLAGHAPYRPSDRNRSSDQVLAALAEGPPEDLTRQAPGAAPELVAVCERAMAHDPGGRYASVDELKEDLQAYLEARVVKAYRTGALAELRKWIARNKMAALAWTVAGVLLLCGSGVIHLLQVRSHRKLEEANAAEASAKRDAQDQAQRANLRSDQLARVKEFLVGLFLLENPFGYRGEGSHFEGLAAQPASRTVRQVVDTAAERIENALDEDPLVRAEVMMSLGMVYTQLHLFPKANSLLRMAHALYVEEQGPGHLDSHQTRKLLIYTLVAESNLQEAYRLVTPEWLQLLEQIDTAAPRGAETYVDSMQTVTELLVHRGFLEQALESAEKTWTVARTELGETHRLTRTQGANYGIILKNLDLLDRSEQVLQSVLDSFRDENLEDHPEALRVRSHLASLSFQRGDSAVSVAQYLEILKVRLPVLGSLHPDTLTNVEALAVYDSRSSPTPAVLETMKAHLESTRSQSLREQAGAHWCLGKYWIRRRAHRQALEDLRAGWSLLDLESTELNPEEKFGLLSALCEAASRTKDSRALQYADELAMLFDLEFGEGHLHEVTVQHRLAQAYYVTGMFEESDRAFTRALDLADLQGQVDSKASLQYEWATMLIQRKELEEARRQLNDLLERLPESDHYHAAALRLLERI